MKHIISKIRKEIKFLNEAGVPLPMIRVNGKASFTATMTFISFNAALLGQAGKIAGFFGGIDLTQANYLFGICLAAYLGRKMQGTDKPEKVEKKEELE